MGRKIAFFFLGWLLLGAVGQIMAQLLPEEIAERAKWEEYLKTARITGQEQLSGSAAVTNPWRLTMEKDGVSHVAFWKNVEGRPKGFIDSWKYEIAAYQMDKLLGLNMVPVTVEIRFQGDRGSCQLGAESEMSLLQKNENKIPVPPGLKTVNWNKATYLQRAFDNLIANEDRTANNILITKDWRIILIDHSRSFRSSKKFTANLIYTEKHKEGPKLMSMLPRAFVEKIKGLTFEMIKGAVGEYLADDEINAVLARKELILKEMDRLVKLNGENNVLYD